MKKSLVRAIYIFGSNGLACLRRSYVTNIRGYRCDHVELLRLYRNFRYGEPREFKVTSRLLKRKIAKKIKFGNSFVRDRWKKTTFSDKNDKLTLLTQNVFPLKISLQKGRKIYEDRIRIAYWWWKRNFL